ncbi:hypothetical protein Tco_0087500 [Tanacetum coccineum]
MRFDSDGQSSWPLKCEGLCDSDDRYDSHSAEVYKEVKISSDMVRALNTLTMTMVVSNHMQPSMYGLERESRLAFETETECQSLMETKKDISVSLFRHKPTRDLNVVKGGKVKRCAEMSRKRYFFKDHISKDGLLSSGVPTVQPDVDLEALEVEDVAVRLLEWVKVAISYLGFRVAKVLVQLQNKVASYALSRVEGEISYNVHKLNESKTADGYERRLWQKANLEYTCPYGAWGWGWGLGRGLKIRSFFHPDFLHPSGRNRRGKYRRGSKKDIGKLLKNSIKNGPYVRKKVMDLGNLTHVPPKAPFECDQLDSELNDEERKQVEADEYAMNSILRGILNNIYTSVDSCKSANTMWEPVRRHMEGSTQTKDLHKVTYDELYDFLKQNKEKALEVKAERDSKHHGPLALVANAIKPPYVPQQNYSPQPYYVTHPSSSNMINDNGENQSYDFQAEEDNDDPVTNLNKAMMLLARAFT